MTRRRAWLKIVSVAVGVPIVLVVGFRLIAGWLLRRVYADPASLLAGDLLFAVGSHPLDYYASKLTNASLLMAPAFVLACVAIVVRQQHRVLLVVFLLSVAVEVRLPGLVNRSIWDDEGISLLQTAGHNIPIWPDQPAPALVAQGLFTGTASCRALVEMLAQTDVHPPLYFCLLSRWRGWFGPSLEAARMLSVVCSTSSVLLFYLLARAARLEAPLVPATVYALASSPVFWGSEARPYALAELFVVAAAMFAHLASNAVMHRGRLALAYGAAAGACCGFAFETNYLAGFPAVVIVLWLLLTTVRRRPSVGFVALLTAASIGTLAVVPVLGQLGARPFYAVGFQGIAVEVRYFFGLLFRVLFYPYAPRWGGMSLYATIGALFVGGAVTYLAASTRGTAWRTWSLLLGLAVGPPIGLLLLNVIFDKHVHDIQYVHYSAVGLAALVAYPISRIARPRPAMGLAAILTLVAIEVAGINWGFVEGPIADANSRSLARALKASASSSQLVLIDAGLGRSNPASLVYELDPRTTMLVFDSADDVTELVKTAQRYDELWVRFSFDYPPNAVRDAFVNQLEASGCYAEVSYSSMVLRLTKRPACDPQKAWPSRPRLNDDFARLNR